MASVTKRVNLQTSDTLRLIKAPDQGFVIYAPGTSGGLGPSAPVAAFSDKAAMLEWLDFATDDESGFTVRL